jgi:tetratricopeptide (TPR) repeat protein
MKLLEGMWQNTKSPKVIGVALSVIRARRDELGATRDALVDGWLVDALRREPDSINLQMQLADFRDIQRNFDEAETIYRKLLSRNDILPRQRGIVLNNIAFLLALEERDLNSAMQFVQEGRDLFGPTSDMLDTMAVVRISRGDAEGAIKDLELAIADSPTAAKYFHLTRAYLLTENKKHKAVQAWGKAIDLGLNLDALNLLEHDEYDRVEEKVESIRRERNRI